MECGSPTILTYTHGFNCFFLFKIPKTLVVLLLSLSLADLVCSASCINKTSEIPGKLFPEAMRKLRNITCSDTCYPVFAEVTYAVIVKKRLVIACRKDKIVSGIAGFKMPLLPLSTQPIIKCKNTYKPRISDPVSVAMTETKPGTLKAAMLPIVVDCESRSK
jgi:hypothetical protein